METVHLRLPQERYDFVFAGDFVGPTERLEFPLPSAFSYQTGKRVVEKGYKFSRADDILAEEERSKTSASVKLVTPNLGSSYYFHRYMVMDSAPSLSVSYIERPLPIKGWWSYLTKWE